MKARLTATFFVLVLIPMLLVSAITSFLYNQSMTQKVNEMVENSSIQTAQMIDERLNIYRDKLYEALTDPNIIGLAKKMNDASSALDVEYQKQRMIAALSGYVSTTGYCNSLIFISDTDYAMFDKTTLDSVTIWNQDSYRQVFLNLCKKQKKITYISNMNTYTDSNGETDQVVYFGYPLYDLVTKKYEGVLVMGLSSKIFEYSDIAENNQDQLKAIDGIRYATINSVNQIMSNYDLNDRLYLELNQYLKTSKQNSNFSILKKEIQGTPWMLICITDRGILLREVNQMKQGMLAVTFVVCLAFFLLMLFTLHRLELSVRRVAAGIHTYEPGEAHIDVELRKTDELYAIVWQFNDMIRRNNQLIDALKDKNEEIRSETEQRKKAELKALETQINPHFLYNVLDSINWMAIDNDEMEISRMLTSLGSILRYSVTNIDTLVLLQSEIEWMKKYVFLQQERLGNKFICTYDVPPNTLGFPIYKMLLQPLVENAVLHAFEGIRSGGVISLRTRLTGRNMLEIRIADNGCGMDEETLQKIRRKIGGGVSEAGGSIGISNVVNRIHLYYKSQAKITVTSSPGAGSEFVLLLPNCQTGEESGTK